MSERPLTPSPPDMAKLSGSSLGVTECAREVARRFKVPGVIPDREMCALAVDVIEKLANMVDRQSYAIQLAQTVIERQDRRGR